jgi:cytochrome c553
MKFAYLMMIMMLAGCEDKSPNQPKSKPQPSPKISQDARDTFNTRCATCHGIEGKGNGPAAAALNPKPRNYTDKSWQKSVSDDQIRSTIIMGGSAIGKSPIMPASPDLENNPDTLNGLVAIIRDFGK